MSVDVYSWEPCLCNLASSRVDVLGAFKPCGNDPLLAQQDCIKAWVQHQSFFWIMATSEGNNRRMKQKPNGTVCTCWKRTAQPGLLRGNYLPANW